MKLAIVIPAHNEAAFIRTCLDSFVNQIHKPDTLIVVDDNSTDDTAEIVLEYQAQHSWIRLHQKKSSEEHLPGEKVIRAFNDGLVSLDGPYDLVGKFDADIILPTEYFEQLLKRFERNPRLGMCAGLLFIDDGDSWIYESISDKNHIRGPVKLYRKACLEAIGGLRESIGWDTIDELLAKFYGYDTMTIEQLKVKHLRPTGASYSELGAKMQGEALYKMGYGLLLSWLAAAKMGWIRGSFNYYRQCMKGYSESKKLKKELMVSPEEARFIRQYRWKNIRSKLF